MLRGCPYPAFCEDIVCELSAPVEVEHLKRLARFTARIIRACEAYARALARWMWRPGASPAPTQAPILTTA